MVVAAGRQWAEQTLRLCAPGARHPAQLLALWRGHWSVENQLRDSRDTACDEDRATVRASPAPQVMAAFRNDAIGLSHCLGTTQVAALAAVGLVPDFA